MKSEKYNIAIVTNNENHHKFFAHQLYKKLNVKIIFSVKNKKKPSIRSKIKQTGIIWFFLIALSKLYNHFSKSSYKKSFEIAEKKMFSNIENKFQEISDGVICPVKTINSNHAIKIVKDNNIDFIIFLGGDIGKNDFIKSANISCLNIHSGISPFYNGSQTTLWAMCEGRPNFTGVTLMHMNEKIDGGNILAHFLPVISSNDNVATLFMKGINGAVDLVIDFIDEFHFGNKSEGIKQERSFKYTKAIDWTIYHDIKLNRFNSSYKISKYERESKVFKYYGDNGYENFEPLLNYLLSKK